MFKIIFSDVDGTLIYKGEKLNTARFPLMLDLLQKSGILFIPCTGRNYSELKVLFGQSISGLICICCDGSCIVQDNKILFEKQVSDKALSFAANLFKEGKADCVEFHSDDKTYILGGSFPFRANEEKRLGNLIRSDSAEQIKGKIYKISAYGIKNKPSCPPGIRECYEKSGIIEYISCDSSKSVSARFIAEKLGVSLSDALFFGDGENDKQMILDCGTSYTTYCASKNIFSMTNKHTRDVIGTVIHIVSGK